jgi:murein DD-endopeptidase MepM/ murein hydrolase activator NlpD
MSIFRFSVLLSVCLLAACQSDAQQTPFVATIPVLNVAQVSTNTLVPTANPLPSRTRTIPPTDTNTPTPSLTPTETTTPSLTPTITDTPTITLTSSLISSPTLITPDASYTQPPTWTPPPPDPASQIADHYAFGRPISDNATNWISRTYPYGGTNGGRLQVHHGVDIQNPTGTLILAVADGTVAYAGNDLSTLFGPISNYYGNLVVIQHNFNTPENDPLYSLYGHMDQVAVQTGQAVSAGDILGTVGGTGVAQGPHLHFEVRVGDPHNFDATRNPELWMRPFQTFGTLAGRVTDADDNLLYEVTLRVESTDITRYAFSYADTSVHSDPAFHETFTLGDLPANYYTVTVSDGNRARFRQIVYIYPNRTTWLNVQLNR